MRGAGRLVGAVAVASLLAGPASPAPASAASGTKAGAGKTRGKSGSKGNSANKSANKSPNKSATKGKDGPPDAPAPIPGSKIAVFPFAGDGAETIQRQVLHVLRSKGMKPNTSLKPMFDTPEQYRETAATLGLAAYVDGEVAIDGADASATIHLRSGGSGLRVWSATFTGERRQLANEVGKRLWEEWSAALGKACADAAKPRKPDREPMRINAGTPLVDHPAATD